MVVICSALLSNQWHRLSTGQTCLCRSKAKFVNQDGIPSCGRHKHMSRNSESEGKSILQSIEGSYLNQDGIPSCGTYKKKSRIVGECAICLSRCIDVETCVTACKHMFHSKCIEQWGAEQWGTSCIVSCPLCRCSLLV